MVGSSPWGRGIFFYCMPFFVFHIKEEALLRIWLCSPNSSKHEKSVSPVIIHNNTGMTSSWVAWVLFPLPIARQYPEFLLATGSELSVPTTVQTNLVFRWDEDEGVILSSRRVLRLLVLLNLLWVANRHCHSRIGTTCFHKLRFFLNEGLHTNSLYLDFHIRSV